VSLGNVFSYYLGFTCQFSAPHSSSSIGQIVAEVPSGLSLTPPQEIKKTFKNVVDLYSVDSRFESRLGHWLILTV
jgi:hypothetical protein